MNRMSWLLTGTLLLAPMTGSLAEEQEGKGDAEVLDFIKANNPEMYEHLSAAKREHPEEYRARMGEIGHMYGDPDTREHFVRTMRVHRQVQEMAQAYRRAEGKDKAAAKDRLQKAIGEMFDEDLSQKELQIKKMQGEIAKLQEKIGKRRSLKDKLVQKRLEQMTGEGEDADW